MTLRYERRTNGYRLTCDACRSMYGIECGRRLKKTFKIAEEMAGMITSAGFVDVVEKRFKWPIGPWSSDPRLKEIGRWNLLNWEEGMEGWVIAPYTRVLGVSVFLFHFPFPWIDSHMGIKLTEGVCMCSGLLQMSRNGWRRFERL